MVAAVIVGELGVDLAHGLSIAASAGYVAANVVEPLVGAALFLRLTHGDERLDRHNGMRWFLVAAVGAGPLVGAVFGGLTRAGDVGAVWWDAGLHFWIGDALGVLAVGAPILAMRGVAVPQGRRLYEAVGALCGVLVMTVLAYWVWEIPPSILLLPPLVMVAFRFGTPGVLIASAGIASVANLASAAGHGLFATLDASPQARLTMGQLFLATTIITAWFLAVETTERARLVTERERQQAVLDRAELRRAIGELSERLVSAGSLDDVVGAFSAVLADRYDVSLVTIVRYDAELDRFRVVPKSLPVSVHDKVATWTATKPIPGAVAMRLGAPIWIADRDELIREFPLVADVASTLQVEALGFVPLPGVDRGYISIGRSGRSFEEDEREVLELMSGVLAEAVERVELFEAEHSARREAELANDKVAALLREVTADAQRLRESENRFRQLADDGPLLVWATDADGNQEWFNRKYCEFFGVDPYPVSAVPWRLTLHPDDRDESMAAWRKAFTEHGEFATTARVSNANGEWRWMETWARPRFDATGRFVGLVGASVDVTLRQQAQAELATAYAFVKEVTRLVPGVISVFDLDLGRQIFASRPSLALGFDLEEASLETLLALVHRDDADAFAAYVVSARDLTDGESASLDYRIRHRDGSWLWFRTSATPLRRTVDGKVAQMSLLSYDVTEQKAREAVLASAASLDALRVHLTDALHDLVGSNEIESAAAALLGEHLGRGSVHFAHFHEHSADDEMAPGTLMSNVDAWGKTIALAVRSGERVVIDEIALDPRLTATVREAAVDSGIASVVMHPMRGDEGITGVVMVGNGESQPWSEHELKAIAETAGRTIQATERDRVTTERKLQRRRATLMADIVAGIESQPTVEGAAQRVVELLVLDEANYATLETFVPDHRILGIAHQTPELVGVLRQLRTRHVVDPPELYPHSHMAIPINMGDSQRGALVVGLSDPGREFTHYDLDFFTDLGRRVEVLLAAKRVRELEHQIAATLQNALLPDDTRWHPAVAVEARYQSAGNHLHVGGDWYDTFAWPDRIGVMVGDVVGHSLESAAAMGRMRTAASALAAVSPPSPAALITALDRFARSPDGVDYSTAAIVIVDPTTGMLTYACAGHPPPLVITPDRHVIRLDLAQSPPLSALAPRARTEAALTLEPGSLVVLYTDGLVERRGESIDLGIERLAAVVVSRFDQPTSNIIDGLIADLTADRPGDDDIAVAAFRYTPLLATLHLEFPARVNELRGLRAQIRHWLTERHVSPDDHAVILIAIGEACTNVIDHAYRARHRARDGDQGGPQTEMVFVDLSDHGTEVVAKVTDSGSWRPSGSHSTDRGRGTDIMRAISNRYERCAAAGGGTIITLSLPAPDRRHLVDR